MPQLIRVHLLPDLADPGELAGHTTVVLDLLRASTTMVYALASGATEIIPCMEVTEARKLARARPGALLGGERGGKMIAGFDLGNSPSEYSASRVQGRSIVFTTTNGTRAFSACIGAADVLIGAFVNLTRLCQRLAGVSPIDLVCAGTDSAISRDDALLAGAIVDQLRQRGAGDAINLNDQALLCLQAWRDTVASDGGLAAALEETAGGRNLVAIGQQSDLELAAQVDRFDVVPWLDRAHWRVCLPTP